MKNVKLYLSLAILFIVVLIYINITRLVQAYKCPKMTNTELLLKTIDNILLKFNNCK